MPTYDVHVHCNDCGEDHPARITVHIKDGPEGKRSIAELINGSPLPPQVAAIRNHVAFCYKTGRKFQLQNDGEIFLVPPHFDRSDAVDQ